MAEKPEFQIKRPSVQTEKKPGGGSARKEETMTEPIKIDKRNSLIQGAPDEGNVTNFSMSEITDRASIGGFVAPTSLMKPSL